MRTSQRTRSIHDDFDGAWKNMLSEKRFSEFIAFFMPDVHTQIDWTRPVEFLEQELRAITRKTRRGHRAVDRLVKVWLKDGTETWVLIHVEVQSQHDPDFPARMFQYYFRASDLFPDRSLACLAILGDDNADWKPDRYVRSLWQTRVEFQFRVVKLMEYSSRLEELERSTNAFARFVVAHLKTLQTQGNYETRLEWKLRIIQGLYDMGVSEAEIGQLYHDFDWLLALPDPLARHYHREMARFEEERTMPHLTTAERIGRQEGRKQGRKEGRAEGKIEGRMEELHESLLEILEVRFGSVAPELAARIKALSDLDHLRRLRKLLVSGASMSDFEQALSG